MGKQTVSITIDNGIWDKAKRMFPSQLSGLISDYLKSLINIKNKDITGINIEIEQLKLSQETKELSKLKAKIDDRTIKINIFREELAKKDQKVLENSKKKIENEKNCTNCGSIIEGKHYKMDNEGKKIYCRSCFMGI